MNALNQLQDLANTHNTDCERLSAILYDILNSDTSFEVFASVVQNSPIEVVIQWCEHLLESSSGELGDLLVPALSPAQKEVLQQYSSIRLQVALIGEYHATDWIAVLQQQWPEIIDVCLENAVAIFEKQAVQEKRLIALMPSLGEMGLVTAIQEKVLLSYIDNLTPAQFERYIQANSDNNRTANPTLVSRHQKRLLTDATDAYAQDAAPRRIKI